jgi:hypothetical protein
MQIVPKSTTTKNTRMAKLDNARSATAWAAFRKASDEHAEKRHEASMKRKRDELKFELFAKRQHVIVEHSLLDEAARIGCYKRHTGEKQLDLDRRRHAFDMQVHADKLVHETRALEHAQAAVDNLNVLYIERQKMQTEVTLLLAQDRKLLNEREALLDQKEDILRHSKLVCSVCLEPAAEGTLRALDPCGHCFCAACVATCGVVRVDINNNTNVPTYTYVGACPTCRTDVADVLRIFP